MPSSSANGSPSRSRNRSPGLGSGRPSRPRSGTGLPSASRSSGRSSHSTSRRSSDWTWIRACSWIRSSAPAPTPSSFGSIGSGRTASPRRVATLARLERAALARRGARDEAEVVVRAPLRLAHDDPAADVAVLDRLGVRRDRRIGGWRGVPAEPDGGLEVGLDAAVVGHVVVDPQRVRGTLPAAEHDVERLRLHALDRRQLLDVRADLEDRRGLDVAGELGVRDLVVPRAERAVGLAGDVVAPQEEVRVAAPGAVEERRLVDDVGAGAHRGDRLLGGRSQVRAGVPRRRRRWVVERRDGGPVLVDLDHAQAAVAQVLEVALLVLDAALRDEVDRRVVADRLLDEPGERGALEREPVVAGEVADEVGGGIDGTTVDQLHARPSYGRAVPARVSRPVARQRGLRRGGATSTGRRPTPSRRSARTRPAPRRRSRSRPRSPRAPRPRAPSSRRR